ncbi:glycosyltransferase family 2 protein [Patescibacteria group bacterium]|nr:glycosyltransferase family 2 protein [Patescibacteria group bacterium]
MHPKVAIIYLCYGNLKHLPEVVKGLELQTYPKEAMTVYMVPNGSPDGIAEAIRREVLPRSGMDLPRIVLIDDGVNHGFAGGNNVATRQALDEGHDYIFLHNGDLKLEPQAIEALVTSAESDEKIGSVQSLVLYWHQPDTVNVSGGIFHLAGYGFARDNLVKLDQFNRHDGEEIAYASGAAVLYRSSALRKVGLLEEGFFMYHEDLELGLRLRIAGYNNILSTESRALHDYSFSRNPKKFAWMELYRWVVILSYYKIATLVILMPVLLSIELGTWFMALTGGWFKAKVWQCLEFFKPRTWKLIIEMRRRAKRLRTITDRQQLSFVTGKIEAQEARSFVVDNIANPIISFCLRIIRGIVVW